jgi:hypothetical protein
MRQDNNSNHRHRIRTNKSVRHPVQQHLPQQEVTKTRLPVQAPSSSDSDELTVATVVQQITKELSEDVRRSLQIIN